MLSYENVVRHLERKTRHFNLKRPAFGISQSTLPTKKIFFLSVKNRNHVDSLL
ncbi:hypothetical protein HYC85_031523 [Camellia sinensis]|uniref:Uncharacterized protein n=1 Tax=Camellia sinensis TaxID=4442 RepID=A0A7J7FQS7_CAMSI|nr:hypothetical protein HYC85_031523 [Camellia sinensis]